MKVENRFMKKLTLAIIIISAIATIMYYLLAIWLDNVKFGLTGFVVMVATLIMFAAWYEGMD